MEVGLEGCLDMLMLCACCLFICTLNTHTPTHTQQVLTSHSCYYNGLNGDVNHNVESVFMFQVRLILIDLVDRPFVFYAIFKQHAHIFAPHLLAYEGAGRLDASSIF